MLMLKPTLLLNGKKYKVISQIGEGAFGYVFHVKSLNKETKYEDYAIKKLICSVPEQLEEAKKEIDIMLKVKHYNILSLIDFSYVSNKKGQEEVMLLLPLFSSSVQTVIDNGPGYPYCPFHDGLDCVKIWRNIIDGLQILHHSGFRHADLKPGNILISADFNQAVLTDFGSCQPISITVTNRNEALEVQEKAQAFTTASYRAPELFDTPSSIIVDGKADIWSFGCLMYVMMYSKTPFETTVEGLSTLSVLTGSFTFPSPIDGGDIWHEDYHELINSCLTVDLAKRIDLEEVQGKLKRLSPPPLDLKVPPATAIEKPSAVRDSSSVSTSSSTSHTGASSIMKSLFMKSADSSVKGKSTMEGIGSDTIAHSNNNSNHNFAVDEEAVIETLDFADFDSSLPQSTKSPDLPSDGELKKVETREGASKVEGILNRSESEDPFSASNDDSFADFASAAIPIPKADQNVNTTAGNNPNLEELRESEEFGDFTAISAGGGDSHSSVQQQSEIIDLHHLIINDIATKRIIKEGMVHSMRLGGFPKKMMKKPVSFLLLDIDYSFFFPIP
jgi:serine/threonine protein kinase